MDFDAFARCFVIGFATYGLVQELKRRRYVPVAACWRHSLVGRIAIILDLMAVTACASSTVYAAISRDWGGIVCWGYATGVYGWLTWKNYTRGGGGSKRRLAHLRGMIRAVGSKLVVAAPSPTPVPLR